MRARLAFSAELLVIIILVLVTRCANYPDVFANGQIYFVDADCYARMTRARICFEHPGKVIRRHDFENFPLGTSPHTTAPLDYLIATLAILLTPFTGNALELSGAIISPVVAIGLGIFLCWWTRRIAMRFRFALLGLYASSPILAHATALGRPDHQSLLIALVTVALCAGWALRRHPTRGWSILSAAAWALAIWVSLYEPLVLLAIFGGTFFLENLVAADKHRSSTLSYRTAWIVFTIIILLAGVVERRIPAVFDRASFALFKNWSGTIGELTRVPLQSAVWFQWCSWLILLSPVLLWPKWRDRGAPRFMIVLLVATFALTMFQARWAYFFALVFTMLAPDILSVIRPRWAAVVIFMIALLPIAKAWDDSWSEWVSSAHSEIEIEQRELRTIAFDIDAPFLAPWWFSPALSYWSRQPGVAGSSHESLAGIADSARFYAATAIESAAEICQRRGVNWIVTYDADRLAENSGRILGRSISKDALGYVLDRRPSQAPPFLKLVRQTARFKLYRVGNF